MPREFASVTNVTGAYASGGQAYARRLSAEGLSFGEIATQLELRYPNLPRQDIRQVIRTAYATTLEATALKAAPPGQILPISEIPIVATIPQQYRYGISGVYRDPNTGEEKPYITYLNSSTQLTAAEVLARGKSLIASVALRHESPTVTTEDEEAGVISVDITSVERMS
jgi:hypothetical protein